MIVLLAGFPDARGGWAAVAPRLVAAGFSVVAADFPGLGESEPLRAPLSAGALATAVGGLCREVGARLLVGHDWGGAAAWAVAAADPGAADRFAVVNCPHPAALGRGAWRRPRQLWRSRYMAVMAAPGGARLAAAGDLAYVRGLRRRWSASPAVAGGGAIVDADRVVREAVGSPGAMRAASRLYRGALAGPFRGRSGVAGVGSVAAATPLLVVHGGPDPVFEVGLVAEGIRRYAPHAARIDLPGGGHFPQVARPDALAEALIAFAAERRG